MNLYESFIIPDDNNEEDTLTSRSQETQSPTEQIKYKDEPPEQQPLCERTNTLHQASKYVPRNKLSKEAKSVGIVIRAPMLTESLNKMLEQSIGLWLRSVEWQPPGDNERVSEEIKLTERRMGLIEKLHYGVDCRRYPSQWFLTSLREEILNITNKEDFRIPQYWSQFKNQLWIQSGFCVNIQPNRTRNFDGPTCLWSSLLKLNGYWVTVQVLLLQVLIIMNGLKRSGMLLQLLSKISQRLTGLPLTLIIASKKELLWKRLINTPQQKIKQCNHAEDSVQIHNGKWLSPSASQKSISLDY